MVRFIISVPRLEDLDPDHDVEDFGLSVVGFLPVGFLDCVSRW